MKAGGSVGSRTVVRAVLPEIWISHCGGREGDPSVPWRVPTLNPSADFISCCWTRTSKWAGQEILGDSNFYLAMATATGSYLVLVGARRGRRRRTTSPGVPVYFRSRD